MTSWSPAAPLITSTPPSDAPEAASAIQGGTPRAVRLSLPGGPPVDPFALAGESGILLAASQVSRAACRRRSWSDPHGRRSRPRLEMEAAANLESRPVPRHPILHPEYLLRQR